MLSEVYKALFKYGRDNVNQDNGTLQMVGLTVGGVIREDMREIERERENYIGTLGTAMD